jgi:hypothetical protein
MSLYAKAPPATLLEGEGVAEAPPVDATDLYKVA